jgi:hypothetical protein
MRSALGLHAVARTALMEIVCVTGLLHLICPRLPRGIRPTATVFLGFKE